MKEKLHSKLSWIAMILLGIGVVLTLIGQGSVSSHQVPLYTSGIIFIVLGLMVLSFWSGMDYTTKIIAKSQQDTTKTD